MSSHRAFLPYGRQTIEDDDIDAVASALRSDYLTTGPRVEEFERAFGSATGARHAVACNSGTAALHLAMLALDLQVDDVAVVPAVTFLATANVVRMTGAEVIFADVDPDTGLLTEATLEAALTRVGGRRPRVALPVHLNGQVCNMEGLAALANRAGIDLVEDACHALGSRDVGATLYSRMACFSTHPVKAIATGEGGMITTASASLADRMRQLRSHGMTRTASEFEKRKLGFDGNDANSWYYEMHEIGWNYRLPDILCALGISQLRKLDRFWQRRTSIAAMYDRLLAPLSPALRPVARNAQAHGWHLYAVLMDFKAIGMTRMRVVKALAERGIGTQVHYIPVHRQPYYTRRYGEVALPGADSYYQRCLSLPFFPAMTDDDVHVVVAAIGDVVRGKY